MAEYSEEKSREEAEILKAVQNEVIKLDEEYLESALKDMRANHSMRDSMAVLNPNPHTHFEAQELNEAKLDVLETILKLRKGMLNVAKCQGKLMRAKDSEAELKNLFGNFFG